MERFGWLGHLPERYAEHLAERPTRHWLDASADDPAD
jgi:tRNA pseudouridine65 synthase